MNQNIIPYETEANPKPNADWLASIARKLVLKRLTNIEFGQITLHDNGESHSFGLCDDKCDLSADVFITNTDFYKTISLGGSIGAGESYIKGFWHCDDLTNLVRILVLNRTALLKLDGSFSIILKPIRSFLHYLNRNTRSGSRKNIKSHYDIGNDLFQLFLDESMMYSSAIYPREDSTLEEAAEYKIDLICKKLCLQPDDHLLEIGTGWGALAIHAARQYGCRVTTTTISDAQYAAACKRVSEAKLEERVTIIKQDYRELAGQYDKIVSVEMLEAVGYEHYDIFFKKCCGLLKPDGLFLIQTITIADQYYENARRSVDFIQRYIFPGGCLPSVNVLTDCISRVTDFRTLHIIDYGDHYARTLRDWRKRFFEKIDQVRELGYPESFVRLWEYYLCYCEGGFLERSIGVSHVLLGGPKNRHSSLPRL